MKLVAPHQDDQQARKYRSRKVRPCDTCRKRKIACFRQGDEACSTCKVRKLNCTYELAPLKRVRRGKQIPMNDKPVFDTLLQRLEIQNFLPDKSSLHLVAPTISESNDDNTLDRHHGRTSLFLGFTGDIDPWILKGLNIYDTSNYRAPSKSQPIYFSLCPTEYLDPVPDRYNCAKVNSVIYPFLARLIGLFFENINPSFPIINQRIFFNQRTCSTLLSSVYVKALQHLNIGEETSRQEYLLRDFTIRSLPLEFSSATLQTVQATLLHLQFYPILIRDANSPHDWLFTSSLVAICQQLGLHLDPTLWDIPIWEKRLRRRLWWATFIQDKWDSFGLSRPSHIHDDDFNVAIITKDDFLNDRHEMTSDISSSYVQGVALVIAMAHLTTVISKILNNFFSVRKILNDPQEPNEIMTVGMQTISETKSIEEVYFPKSRPHPSLGGSWISLHIAKVAIIASCCKHLLNSTKDCFSSANSIFYSTIQEFNKILSGIEIGQLNTNWWSYSRLNLSIIGSTILAFYVASGMNNSWSTIVYEFKSHLELIARLSMILKLALLRYEKILRIIDNTKKQSVEEIVMENENLDPASESKNAVNELVNYGMEDDFLDWLTNDKFLQNELSQPN
ncbi:uncharacterized protein PRCAT00005878001 [Priceomyces carsonii]|uniref:uncharacterized protein n=1 Tax=Priceomyces carsonii TaxID=28549 RepID=UPI002EDAFFA1|nr:unnamed protein product [Priceomyces carsonii]